MAGGESIHIHTPRHLTLIQTGRLLLRPFTQADAERLHVLFDTHPDVWRYDGRFPRGLEQRRALLCWRLLDFEREGWGAMGVVIRASGELIGQAGLQYWLCPQADGTALPEVELFYKLGRDYWGQGYATEAGHARHTLFVADLDALVAQIAERGLAPVLRETYANGVRKTTYRDPDGNEIGFGGASL